MKETTRICDFFFLAVLGLLLISLPGTSLGGYILDPEFNGGGKQVVEIGNLNDRGNGIAVAPDGKIVVAGSSESDSNVDVAVVRYTSDGSLDTTFNIDGMATFALGNGDDGGNGVAVKSDGTIVVAGYLQPVDGKKLPALIQITPAGNVDLAFGESGSGFVTLTDGDNSGEAFGVVLDDQERIVVGGFLQSETGQQWAMAARYLADGRLDTSFGENGLRRIETEGDTLAHFITLQNDGKIVLGGVKTFASVKTAALYRLNEDGSVDTAYGTEGEAVIGELSGDSEFYAAAVLEDDSLVAAGYTTADGRKSITTARFTAAGQIDPAFGAGGVAVEDLADDGVAYGVTVRSDSTYLVAGEGGNGTDSDIVLIHLDSAGNMQSSTMLRDAGGNGEQTQVAIAPLEVSDGINLQEYELMAVREESEPLLTDINGENDGGRGVSILESGRVLVAGFASDGVDDDIALVAFVGDVPVPADEEETSITEIPFFIGTLPVTNATRNGAMSGGVISENDLFVCDSSISACPLTVTARGVVFSVTSYPSFRETTDDNQDTGQDGEDDSSSVFPGWVSDSAHNSDVVRRGQTSDGSGKGTFGSDITEITPDTFYFVRAYGVLSDGTVIYGNQLTFKTDDACFIATAAFGSPLEGHVVALRQFRDAYLKTSDIGRRFVGLYYQWSPGLAEVVGGSALLRFAVRILLLPLVAFSSFMVYLSLQMKVVLLLLTGGAFFITQRILSRR